MFKRKFLPNWVIINLLLVSLVSGCSSGSDSPTTSGADEDDTPPVVSTVSPADGVSNVESTISITATFDDPMLASTLNTANFTVTGASSGAVSGTVSYDANSKTVTFTPSQVLRAYDTYTAILSTAVQNAAALPLAAAESWSFTIQEPPVQQVSSVLTAGNTTTPTVVYNSAGDGIAVWEVSNLGRSLVYSVYDSGTDSWSTEAILSSITNSNSMGPQLVSNGTGFAMVWREFDGTVWQLYSSFYDGTNWSTKAIIDTEDTTSVNAPKLASNGTGYAVTWYQSQSSQDRIFARVSTDGSTWGGAVIIDNGTSSARSPKISSNGSGYAAIWEQDNDRIAANVYNGAWSSGTAVFLDVDNGNSPTSHQIASNGTGYSTIWYKYDGTRNNVLSSTYFEPGGTGTGFSWSTQADIDGTTIWTIINSEDSIASNGTGYAVGLRRYTTASSSPLNAYATVNAAGNASWSTPQSLESGAGSINNSPKITSNGTTYAALWSQNDGVSTNDLLASVFNGSSWGGAVIVDAAVGSVSSTNNFQLASSGTKYIAAWLQQVSGVNSVFSNVYDSGWGAIEAIETSTENVSAPSATSNPSTSGMTVAWSATGTGVFTNTYSGTAFSGQLAISTSAFGGSSNDPILVHNGNGQTLSLWLQFSGNNFNLYANIHQNGNWGTPTVLSDQSVSFNTLHATTNGTGFAVAWTEFDGSFTSLYASVYDGTSWGTKTEIDDPVIDSSVSFFSRSTGPAIASNGSGYMVAFQQFDSTSFTNAYATQYDGTDWGTPVALNTPSTSISITPQISSNGTTYLAIWFQFTTYSKMLSNEFDGTSWGTVQDLETSGFSWQTHPTVINNGSTYLAAWSQQDAASETRAFTNFYSSGSWGSAFAVDSATAGTSASTQPDIAFSGNGRFAVAWREFDGTNQTINVTTYDGTTWLAPTTVDDGASGSVFFDAPTYNTLISDGTNFAVSWRRSDGTVNDMFSSVFNGTSWSTATALETGSGTTSEQSIASDSTGFLVAWRQDNGSGIFDIVTNRYDSTAGTWAGETIIDQDASNSAFDLNLSGSMDGYFATWTQPDPAGDPAVRFPWAKVGF